MPTTSIRLTESEHQALNDVAGSDGKSSFIRRCLALHPRWTALKLQYDEDVVGRMMDAEQPGARANVDRLPSGAVVILDDRPYQLGDYVQKDRGTSIANMRICSSLNGDGKVRYLREGTIVEIGNRLDERIPADLLSLVLVERKILAELSRGPKTLAELCRSCVDTRRFDPERMVLPANVVGQFIKHLIPLLVGELVTVDIDRAKESPWRLTARGRAVVAAHGLGG